MTFVDNALTFVGNLPPKSQLKSQLGRQINFDVTFSRLPCSVLSLDAMDVSGEHELDVVHDVYKRKAAQP